MKTQGWIVRAARRLGGGLLGLALAATVVTGGRAQTASDEPVVIRPASPEFTVTLDSGRASGFLWYLVSLDDDLIEAVGHTVAAAGEGADVGTPAEEHWTFKARPGAFAVPRVTTIVLRHMRPGEPIAGREAHVTVILEPGS